MIPIYAIDPGPVQSAIVGWDGERILLHWQGDNATMLARVRAIAWIDMVAVFAVEKVVSHGLPAGAPLFESVFWTGRYCEAWESALGRPAAIRMSFGEVRLHLCHSSRAKESYVRRAILDRLGEPGTKKHPGITHGVHGHEWSALALAVTVLDTITEAGASQRHERATV